MVGFRLGKGRASFATCQGRGPTAATTPRCTGGGGSVGNSASSASGDSVASQRADSRVHPSRALGLVFVEWRIRKAVQQSGEEAGVLHDRSDGWDILVCWEW